ncbi:MAG TPA: hypothetical protein VKH18_09225 [Terriglobales bacterium]|nr:hypothetical protein [Terriglobales bacterium]
MKYRRIAVALLATAALLSVTVASAQEDARLLGTPMSGLTAGAHARPETLDIFLTASYASASYGTGGVALRNRRTGEIAISGVSGSTQAAWLYWAVLLSNPTATQLTKVAKVTIARTYPTGAPSPSSAAVTGTLLNVGGDPCWGSSGAWVYRAAVPTTVATGNGLYKITLSTAESGLTDGEDPWDGNRKFPMWEGATLVIVGQGSATVGLLDGQAGTTFLSGGYSNYYQLPATVAAGSQVLLDNFGYDGQLGSSRFGSASQETSTALGWPSQVNNILFAGQGSTEASDSDWDGSSGWPLPQLWDDTGHDISNAFEAGDYWVLVSYSAPLDCVGTVGAVVSVH